MEVRSAFSLVAICVAAVACSSPSLRIMPEKREAQLRVVSALAEEHVVIEIARGNSTACEISSRPPDGMFWAPIAGVAGELSWRGPDVPMALTPAWLIGHAALVDEVRAETAFLFLAPFESSSRVVCDGLPPPSIYVIRDVISVTELDRSGVSPSDVRDIADAQSPPRVGTVGDSEFWASPTPPEEGAPAQE